MKRRAFTLIELLVVVAIIALLIAILLPSLGKARANARRTVCGTSLHSWGQAFAAYGTEWDNSILTAAVVTSAYLPNNIREGNPTKYNEIYATTAGGAPLNAYLGNPFDMVNKTIKRTALCPGIDQGATVDYIHNGWITNPGRFNTTYAFFGGSNHWVSDTGAVKETAVRPQDLATTKYGSMRLLMNDELYYHTSKKSWYFNHGAGGAPGGLDQPNLVIDGLNELFTDGHVEWKKISGTDIQNMKASVDSTDTTKYPYRIYQGTGGSYAFFY